MSYDFSTLNDKDFEVLVTDLLRAAYGWNLQSFKSGKDRGIDLRWAGLDNHPEIIVQVKHYVRTPHSLLIANLRNKEARKLEKLAPKRYIIVVSDELSATKKDEIRSAFGNDMVSADDVIGREDLNRMLRTYPEVEKSHVKLWLSSTAVLERILNNAVTGRSSFHRDRIRSMMRLYVNVERVQEAIEILGKQNVLVVTGVPGIGKTTLSDMVSVKYAEEGYQVIEVESIREAEDVFDIDGNSKQLFIYNDFLGETRLEVNSNNRLGGQIASFVDRLKHSENKRMILTTRTVILNQARVAFDKINRMAPIQNEFELRLNNYSTIDKAQILYNHLYFSGLTDTEYDAIIDDGFYHKIIYHMNYNPRLIEHITRDDRGVFTDKETYRSFVLRTLDYPDEVWEHSYEQQIGDVERLMLLAVWSLGHAADFDAVEKVTMELQIYAHENYGRPVVEEVMRKGLKVLTRSFLIVGVSNAGDDRRFIRPINPSLNDYIEKRLVESRDLRLMLFRTALFVEQLLRLVALAHDEGLSEEEQSALREAVLRNPRRSRPTNSWVEIAPLELLSKWGSKAARPSDTLAIWRAIYEADKLLDVKAVNDILLRAGPASELEQYLRGQWAIVGPQLLRSMSTLDEVPIVCDLFRDVGGTRVEDFPDAERLLTDQVETLAQDFAETYFEDMRRELKRESDVEALLRDFESDCASMTSGVQVLDQWNWKEYLEEGHNWTEVLAENQESEAYALLSPSRQAKDKRVVSQEEVDELFGR